MLLTQQTRAHMVSGHRIQLAKSTVAITLFGMVSAAAFSAPQTSSRAQIPDQRGISEGWNGTELETAPLSKQESSGAQPISTPATMPANGSATFPYAVVPYVRLPSVAPTPPPMPRLP